MRMNETEEKVVSVLRNEYGYTKREAETSIYEIREGLSGDRNRQVSPIISADATGRVIKKKYPNARALAEAYVLSSNMSQPLYHWVGGDLEPFFDEKWLETLFKK